MAIDALMIHEGDNVATALRDIEAGEVVTVGLGTTGHEMTIHEDVAYGHKFATRDIATGALVLKYGETMGRATSPIGQGTYAHIHNIESLRGRGDLEKGDMPA